MRYYVVGHTIEGNPYIEGEVSNRFLTEDVNNDLITEEEASADPALVVALRLWKEGDDIRAFVDKAKWALKEHEQDLTGTLRRFKEIADMLRDTDDVWCETIRDAIPHLEAVVEPVRKLLAEENRDRAAHGEPPLVELSTE